MDIPLVSCILPTANRPNFMHDAIKNFLQQDYFNKELIIIDDGKESIISIIPDHPQIYYFYNKSFGTIGIKRNIACEKSKGDYIMHLDDDDLYASDWISRQIAILQSTDADITGLNKILFYAVSSNYRFVFKDDDENKKWVCGATMAYKKNVWHKYHFSNMQIGEDTDFLKNSGGKIFINNYFEGFLARVHDSNVSIQNLIKTTMEWTDSIH